MKRTSSQTTQIKGKQSPRWIALEMLAAIVLAMWAVFALQTVFGFDFSKFGILPRTKEGLIGIILSPFIHENVEHIGYNTLALVLVSLILALSYPKKFIWGFWILLLTTGILVWVFARSAYHMGCSGVVFSLVGFTFAYGIARRSVLSIILAILVGATYAGMLYGVLPIQKQVSWESHLLGILSGIFWGIIWGRADFKKAQKAKLQAQTNTTNTQTEELPADTTDINGSELAE